MCLLLPLYPPSDFKHPGLFWHGFVTSPLWERRDPLSCIHWPSSPPVLLRQPWSLAHGTETFLWAYKISLPSIFKRPMKPLASKLHISWDSVRCSLCSLDDLLGVPVVCTSKWVQLPPTSLPSSQPTPRVDYKNEYRRIWADNHDTESSYRISSSPSIIIATYIVVQAIQCLKYLYVITHNTHNNLMRCYFCYFTRKWSMEMWIDMAKASELNSWLKSTHFYSTTIVLNKMINDNMLWILWQTWFKI